MSEPGTEDGLLRCPWANSTPDYIAYHDREWGRPVHGETALFERLTLEAFQSGLSWLTILRKRPAFRSAFAGFEAERVAAFDDADRARLLADPGIVRNRAKVAAAIANARAVLALRDAVDGGLDAFVWSFASPPGSLPAPRTLTEVPASTPRSVALAKGLKRYGFVFVGPTTAYAAMQACGMVDDHLADCHARALQDLPPERVESPSVTVGKPKFTELAAGVAARGRFAVQASSGIMRGITLRGPATGRAARTPDTGRSGAATRKGMAPMAAMKPRTGDGPLEVTKEGRGIVMRVPLEGGGRLVVEMSATEASELGEALKAVAG